MSTCGALRKNDIHFEAHVDVAGDMKVSETCTMKRNIDNLLKEKFNINHTTMQFKSEAYEDISLVRHSKDRQFGGN